MEQLSMMQTPGFSQLEAFAEGAAGPPGLALRMVGARSQPSWGLARGGSGRNSASLVVRGRGWCPRAWPGTFQATDE